MYPLFYLGNIAYWKVLCQTEKIVFDIAQPIPKKSYVNRTIILTANGIQALTIPLKGGRGSKSPLSELEISYAEKWIDKHKMALLSAYSKSPFYEYYMPYFERILDSKFEKLVDINYALTKEIHRILKLQSDINLISSDTKLAYHSIPNEFHSISEYPQVFRYKFPFYPDLSILDLLFNLGPDARTYLTTTEINS